MLLFRDGKIVFYMYFFQGELSSRHWTFVQGSSWTFGTWGPGGGGGGGNDVRSATSNVFVYLT